ncbi:MAG TPA: hypothetical protein VIM99_06485, partial [Blastocatellia bacterium]
PYTEAEKTQYARLVAERLGRPADSVRLQLIEIPTAAALLAIRAGEERREAPPTVAQLRSAFWQGVEAAMRGVRLPPSMRLLGYRVVTGSGELTRVTLAYLGERDIESDAQALIADDVRARLAIPDMELSCERIPSLFGPIGFRRNQASLPAGASHLIDQIGQILKRHSDLRAEVVAQAEGTERERIAEDRGQAVSDYLSERCGVAAERIKITATTDAARDVIVKLALAD